jgi:hypothetical protein
LLCILSNELSHNNSLYDFSTCCTGWIGKGFFFSYFTTSSSSSSSSLSGLDPPLTAAIWQNSKRSSQIAYGLFLVFFYYFFRRVLD